MDYQKLEQLENENKELKARLEHLEECYRQLKSLKEIQIKQAKNATKGKLSYRLNHEIDKLEPFFSMDYEVWQDREYCQLPNANC